jgi:phosphatidate cytidylyltransferase
MGRHKLAPAISPSKTVEGAAGAVLGAMLIAWLASLWFFDRRSGAEALVLAVAISVLAQFGDLCESALKRAFGAKDSGWIIPGHGGILDRLDSLLFPFVFAYYYAVVPRV